MSTIQIAATDPDDDYVRCGESEYVEKGVFANVNHSIDGVTVKQVSTKGEQRSMLEYNVIDIYLCLGVGLSHRPAFLSDTLPETESLVFILSYYYDADLKVTTYVVKRLDAGHNASDRTLILIDLMSSSTYKCNPTFKEKIMDKTSKYRLIKPHK